MFVKEEENSGCCYDLEMILPIQLVRILASHLSVSVQLYRTGVVESAAPLLDSVTGCAVVTYHPAITIPTGLSGAVKNQMDDKRLSGTWLFVMVKIFFLCYQIECRAMKQYFDL